MSWAHGLMLVGGLILLGLWLAGELLEVLAMRRRARERAAWERYVKLIEEESWKGPTN